MRFRRRKPKPHPERQASHDMDLHERALPELTRRAADNPRLAALLAEIERGRERSHQRDIEDPAPVASRGGQAPAESLHAHQITREDAALFQMLAGARFDDNAQVTLPSGVTITGAEMRRWIEANS